LYSLLYYGNRKLFNFRDQIMRVLPRMIISLGFINTQTSVTSIGVRFWKCSLSPLPGAARQFHFPFTITTVEWISLVQRYLKVLIPRSLEHMLPYQNPVMSLPLPCGTTHTDDHRDKKRRNAKSALPLRKRKPLLSTCCECLIMASLFRLSTYVRWRSSLRVSALPSFRLPRPTS